MAAVTQLIPNYLGGVSRQSDDKKKPGQVTNLLNATPDITYGLLKRSGFSFVRDVKDSGGASLDYAKWFFLTRGGLDAYIGAITNDTGSKGSISLWNVITGLQANISYPNGRDYLDIAYDSITNLGPEQHYSTTTIQDVTVITNTAKVVKALAPPSSYVADKAATCRITLVEYGANYSITVNGTKVNYKTRNFDDETSTTVDYLDATEILTALKGQLDAKNISGLSVTVLSDCLELKFTNASTFTSFEAVGGIGNSALNGYITDVIDVSFLPTQSLEGRTVQILNASGDEDDYWLSFKAENNTSGPGTWIESRDPQVSSGLDVATMPHELVLEKVENGVATFAFKPVDWVERKAGDDTTNPMPSFVSSGLIETTIQYSFFYGNRFGLLSEDNIILSQSNDPYNFFKRSAQLQVDSDPIDVNVASINPVRLISCVPEPQGLILFSAQEQFRLFSFESVLTPSTTQVRSLSRYEVSQYIPPESLGTSIAFVSKTPSYSRCYLYQTKGLEEVPSVVDISKTVSQWIPDDVSGIATSPQNSLVALYSSSSKQVFIYRYYNSGEKDLFQAWTEWEMPGDVVAFNIINDQVFVITKQNDEYTLLVNDLNENSKNNVVIADDLLTDQRIWSNPYLDLAFTPADGSIVFDFITNKSTITLPYTNLSTYTPCVVVCAKPAGPTAIPVSLFNLSNIYQYVQPSAAVDDESGYFLTPTVDGNTWVLEGDWTADRERMVCGYRYNFQVELPDTYYNVGESRYDYSAVLTIARYKFSVGFTGAVQFSLKTLGRKEWQPIYSVTDADYYKANDGPLVQDRIFTVPIYQQNKNFKLKVDDSTPFPTALTSMMWEGNYVPRFYQRKIK